VSTQSIVNWVVCLTSNLPPSQAPTLALIVAAAVRLERINLAQLGRRLAGQVAAKPTTKRVWRFTCNDRIEIADAMKGVIARLVRNRKKRLIVSFDWTGFRSFHTLMAAAAIKGRAGPLRWASYPEWKLFRSQNSLAEGLLRLLRTLLPDPLKVISRADRGFGRAEWAAVCQELKFHCVVRITSKAPVACTRYRGVLSHYPTVRGIGPGAAGCAIPGRRAGEPPCGGPVAAGPAQEAR
jgi:hypothetical protein